MLSGINPTSSPSDEVNRQSSAIAKRREQLRRWDESETNRESPHTKISQRVKFQQAYVFLAACSSSDRDEVEKLLQRGVDINTSNIDGLTALHQACIDNNLLMVEYLLNRSADINCQDNEGWTPLHAAASCGNIDIVKYLLSHGAKVDICNNEGELPIDIAEGDDIIASLEDDMRRKGIDDEKARNSEHELMLKHAQDWLNNNQKTNSKPLAETIVDPKTGATSLHVACAKGYLDVIDILLRAGANINAPDNDGWTPLHAAAHWDKHDIIKLLLDKNADLDAKNYAGQTPLDVCDGATFELLKELKEKRPPVKTPVNETPDNIAPWKRKPPPSRPTDQQKPILRSDSHNENLETTAKTPPPTSPPAPQSCISSSSSSLPLSSADENLSNCSPSIKEKLSNLQRSLHDLSNRYLKTNQDEPINSTNNDLNKCPSSSSTEQQTTKQTYDKLGTNSNSTSTRPTFLSTNKYSQRTFTNPLQSLTSINNNNNINNNDLTSRESPTTTTTTTVSTSSTTTANAASSPTQSLDNKINRSFNETQPEVAPRRWGAPTDRAAGDGTLPIPNNTGPYVRRRSGAGVTDSSTTTATTTTSSSPAATTTTPATVVSVTTSVPSSATTNVTVTSTTNPIDDLNSGKRRSNLPPNRDEEAEAQRKHRSAQARRERRSTQSVTVDDIKAAEQQIKNQPNTNSEISSSSSTNMSIPQPLNNTIETPSTTTLSNNKIGAPSTPSAINEHDIETERLQRIIEDKKDKSRRTNSGNEDIADTTVDASSSTIGSRRLRSRFTSADSDNPVPSITANDSLNLGVGASLDSQQQQPRRRTNRVHNQRKNTGRIIWNDETKEVEIRDDPNDLVPKTSYQQTSIEDSHRSDDQKLQDNAQQSTSNSNILGSRGLISRFEHNPSTTNKETTSTNLSPTSPPSSSSSSSRTIRSQSQDPSRKSLTTTTTSVPSSSTTTTTTTTTTTANTNSNNLINGMASSTPFAVKKDSKENTVLNQGISTNNNDAVAIKRLYDDAKRKADELTQKVDRLEREITERDQMIEKLKTSQYIESSLDKREKRAYERKISELEEELKKMDSIKADNTRLKEENAALIRVISKLSK